MANHHTSKGRTRKPQLVQVTGSSRRDWRWLSRGARRRGQYLAGCEPVCGGITCSGRQDALPRLSPIANRGTALRAARCRGHDHPSSAVLFGATEPLQRAVDSSQSSELSRWMSTRSDMSDTSSLHRTRRAQPRLHRLDVALEARPLRLLPAGALRELRRAPPHLPAAGASRDLSTSAR